MPLPKRKTISLLLVLLIGIIPFIVQGQEESDGIDVRRMDLRIKFNRDTLQLKYLEIPDSLSLLGLIDSFRPENYPLAVIRKQPATQIVNLLTDYDAVVAQYEKMQQTYQEIDSLNRESETRLKNIIELEKARAQNFIDANEKLRTEAELLNGQLNRATAVLDDSLDRRTRKSTWLGIIGGAVGLSLGVTIGLLAQ